MIPTLITLGILFATGPSAPEQEDQNTTSVLDQHGYEMVPIPPGSFMMGSPDDEVGRDHDETLHEVRITEAFELGKTEVTIRLFEAVMGNTKLEPVHYKSAVPYSNWFTAIQFCNNLSELEGFTPAYRIEGKTVIWDPNADGYRLPTEAEWEYAARGGESYIYLNVADRHT